MKYLNILRAVAVELPVFLSLVLFSQVVVDVQADEDCEEYEVLADIYDDIEVYPECNGMIYDGLSCSHSMDDKMYWESYSGYGFEQYCDRPVIETFTYIYRALEVETETGYDYEIKLYSTYNYHIDTYYVSGGELFFVDYEDEADAFGEYYCVTERLDDLLWYNSDLFDSLYSATVTKCELAPPCVESPILYDTSTTAGSRYVSAGQTLVMVNNGSNRTAVANFSCIEPTWSTSSNWTANGMSANYSGQMILRLLAQLDPALMSLILIL